ncbi:MAG: TlpA disulfide reductase family protein [Gammaproteobacteria bacterium]|nr:TlpA disulfide reductase family protein [Gammaproteobacteria bacterium]
MRRAFLTLLLTLFVQHSYAQDVAAPAFTLPDAAGQQVTLPRTHDGVDIYLFWASWCPYCKALMPHLQSMRVEYGDDVTIYALNIRDEEMPELFMLKHGYDFILIPEADSVMELYGVRATPALFVVDGKGTIRFNLNDMVFNDNSEFKSLSHGKKAGRRAPYWSAEIRQTIDKILRGFKDD